MSTLSVMNSTGDVKLMWDSANEVETEAARTLFNETKAKGHLAYTVNADGEKAEVVHEFDPKAERIIMAPQMVGG